MNHWLENAIAAPKKKNDRGTEVRYLQTRALLLLGFWRGFRSDELIRLRAEHGEIVPGKGMTCYLPVTKTDRQITGTTFKAPALAHVCSVEAYLAWVGAAQISDATVFGVSTAGGMSAKKVCTSTVWYRCCARS
ncbi:hypothetical protein [Noviherbaspirillum malthae]|uniref:hypothetical protein n=1 Tax=Noviherbaspirillum malthae TaxID=1260987 RepID=UPI0018906BC1|nr:hypothetical protein [Noviherbaspirillum malthae]